MMPGMANTDSAFLWETEALRSAAHRQGAGAPRIRSSVLADPDFVTLREANEITGIPVSTLRKWVRHDDVPSHLEDSSSGQLRMVSLDGVYRRAEDVGRDVSPSDAQPEGRPGRPEPATGGPDIPEGTMLVPLDAWNKMLNQLGNLHEAGQQLAEARERAAKAETEAGFLRERLAELRVEMAERRAEPAASVAEPPVSEEPKPETEGDPEVRVGLVGYSAAMARHILSTWRGRPRR